MDQQKRFVLAMAISGVLVLVWQYFFAPPPLPNVPGDKDPAVVKQDGDKKGDGQADAKGDQKGDQNKPTATNTPPKPAPEAKKVAVSTQEIVTDKFKLGLSNAHGGRITSIDLLDPEQYQKAGDLLAVRSAGAYGFVMSSNYNTRNRPPELMVDGEQVHIVRRRETLEEQLGPESCLPE